MIIQTRHLTTTTPPASTSTPVRPGSPELTALLDRISVGADTRDRDLVAPHEQIGRVRAGRDSHPPRRPFPGDLGPVRR